MATTRKKATKKRAAKKAPRGLEIDQDDVFDYLVGSALEGVARKVGMSPTRKVAGEFYENLAVVAHNYAVELFQMLGEDDSIDLRLAFYSGRALSGFCARVGSPKFSVDSEADVARAALACGKATLELVDEDDDEDEDEEEDDEDEDEEDEDDER